MPLTPRERQIVEAGTPEATRASTHFHAASVMKKPIPLVVTHTNLLLGTRARTGQPGLPQCFPFGDMFANGSDEIIEKEPTYNPVRCRRSHPTSSQWHGEVLAAYIETQSESAEQLTNEPRSGWLTELAKWLKEPKIAVPGQRLPV